MQRVEEKEGNVGCGRYSLRTEMETSGPSSLSGELSHVGASPDHPNCLLLHSLIPSGKVALIMSDSSITTNMLRLLPYIELVYIW